MSRATLDFYYPLPAEKQQNFFGVFLQFQIGVDNVVGTVDGKVWIIETKGGFARAGDSEDIDKYTAKKFLVLKKYLIKYGLQGGIVRQDKQSSELCICTDTYSDDIKSDSWCFLSDVM